MGQLTPDLAGRELLAADGLGKQVFQRVIGVGVIGVKPADVGQIQGHRAQARDVGSATGVDVKLDRQAFAGGNDLNFKAVRSLTLDGRAAPVGRAREQLAARDADVVARGHGKRVNDVAGLGMQFF